MPQHGQQSRQGESSCRWSWEALPVAKADEPMSPKCGKPPTLRQWPFPYTALWPNTKAWGALISMVNEISSQGVQKSVALTKAAF